MKTKQILLLCSGLAIGVLTWYFDFLSVIGSAFLILVISIIVSFFLPEGNYEPSPMRRLMVYMWKGIKARRVVLLLLVFIAAEWYLYFSTTKAELHGFFFAVSIWIWMKCTKSYHDLHWIYFEYMQEERPQTQLRVWPIIFSGIVMYQYGMLVYGNTSILSTWIIPIAFGFAWKGIVDLWGQFSFSMYLDEVHAME